MPNPRARVSLATLALSLTSAACFADATPFTGPTVAMGIGFGTTQNDLSPSADDYMFNAKGFSQATLDVSYGIPLSDRIVANLGVSFDRGSIAMRRPSMPDELNDIGPGLKMKRHRSVYLAPGVILSPKWQLYAKFGYHQVTVDQEGALGRGAIGSSSTQLAGTSVGAGVSWAMARNLEMRMEIEDIQFDSFTYYRARGGDTTVSNQPSMTRANLMIGYRF